MDMIIKGDRGLDLGIFKTIEINIIANYWGTT